MQTQSVLKTSLYAACLISAFSAPVAHASMVGYWSMDEGSGTQVADGSGNSNNGVLVNGSNAWTTGVKGSAIFFPGVTGSGSTRVEIPDANILDITNAISFSAWVKPRNASLDAPILAKEAGGNLSYWFGVLNNKYGMLLDNDGSGWAGDDRDNGTVASNSDWMHLVSTWDGSVIRHFVNGVALADTTSYSQPIFQGTAKLTIGVNSDYNFTAFDGAIDEVYLFNHALSQQEITQLHELPYAVPEPETSVLMLAGLAMMGFAARRRAAT